MKFLHCSDLHVDSPLLGLERYPGAPVEEIRSSTRKAFDNLVDAAIENKVDFVAIAGDVFDGNWRDFNTGLYFQSRVARLREAGIKVVMVRGNHDAESEITRHLRLPENLIIFGSRKPESLFWEDLGVAIHGQSFADRVVAEDIAAQYPRGGAGVFNVGLLHTSLGGYSSHATYAPTTVDILRDKAYQYWALGHVHDRQLICETPRVMFSGNSQGRHARETGPKGCEFVTVDDGIVTSEFLPLDVVRWATVEVDIGSLNDLEELFGVVHRKLQAAADAAGGRIVAVRVRLNGAGRLHSVMAADPEKVESELRALANDTHAGSVWIEKVRRETRPTIDRAQLVQREDALGEVLKLTTHLDDYPTELMALAKEALGPLFDKLPLEAKEKLARLDDPATLRDIVREAEGALLGTVGTKL
jgi:DNA repair exonuclease SbcCD nuclease subunit